MLERARAGRQDAILGGWQINIVPTGMRELWTSVGIGGLNYGVYASPAFDAKVEEAAAATELATARRLWHEAIAIINDDAPAVWLFAPTTVAGINQRLGNVTIRADEWWATLWTWTAGSRQPGTR
jgi:oligopeptide transport system substrate-binding protein